MLLMGVPKSYVNSAVLAVHRGRLMFQPMCTSSVTSAGKPKVDTWRLSDLLDFLGAVWRPCIIFEVVPIHLGSERSVEHLALSAHVSVWRAFVPFVSDVRSPLYASARCDLAAEATLWRFFSFDGAKGFVLLRARSGFCTPQCTLTMSLV